MADKESRAGLGYGTSEVLAFVNPLHGPHDAAAQRAFDAPALHDMPAIQLGVAEARLIEMLVRLTGARKVVEVGTLAGYSTIFLARGVGPDGHVWTIEADAKHAAVARDNIEAAGLLDRVTICVGTGADVLPTLTAKGPFDGVFIDADKVSYDLYGRWAADNLRKGGFILGDNAYLFGRLMNDAPDAVAMRSFHEHTAKAFESVCIPTPDGLVFGLRR